MNAFTCRLGLLAGAVVLAMAGSVGVAATLRVPEDYATIQQAIDSAGDGDEVIVSPGRYVENLRISGKDLVLRSLDPADPSIVRQTIIDGGGRDSVITLDETVTEKTRIAGFTITKGFKIGGLIIVSSTPAEGGGIQGNGSSATIDHNRITENGLIPWGAFCEYGDPSARGGGISRCDGIIAANRIDHNTVYAASSSSCNWDLSGGGLDHCGGTIVNNVIDHNRVSHASVLMDKSGSGGGGAAFCDGFLVNNTFFANEDEITSSVLFECRGEIRNDILWGSKQWTLIVPSYCCIEGWRGEGEGNITSDPRFLDPENGDFHLRSDSLCIDTGGYSALVTEDFDGDPRPIVASHLLLGDDSHFDIGADEYVPDVLPAELILAKLLRELLQPDGGDFNNDGQVDVADWIAFLRQ